MITLRTTHGDISIELDFDNAPITAANYLQYACLLYTSDAADE